MAWRNVRFAHLHAARAVGVSAITANATVDTAYPVANLIDDRPSVRFKWTDDAANHNIIVDLGAAPATGINRLWIPNHNITGDYIVEEDSVNTFDSGDLATLKSGSMVSGTDLDVVLVASAERYLRFKVMTSGIWELGQLMFSELVTLEAGTAQGWADEPIPNVLQLASGDSLQFDPNQRSFEFTWPQLGLAAAVDLTKVEAIFAAVSTYRPFLFDPPYDTEVVRFVKFSDRPRVRVNTEVPASDVRKAEVVISMLDFIG